ncbi:hypothetical protein LTR17_021269 [Elasticomyces elasticus]|nr:hypothetical protein LTR17_021269 [Elasticomyces elasticus]
MSSTSRNTDGPMSGGGGSEAFHSSVERSEPLTTHGHQPGKLVGNEAKPEFEAKTLPAGSAPSKSTFAPNPTDNVPPVQQYQDSSSIEADAPQTSASDTLGGASSAQVHQGLGKPIQGQSSSELRDGSKGRTGGTEGVNTTSQSGISTDAMPSQRALDNDNADVGRGEPASAEDRVPESSTTVASEATSSRN